MRTLTFIVAAAVVIVAHSALAASMTLNCPPLRRVGEGLIAVVTLESEFCVGPSPYGETLVSLVGNADATKARVGVFGPFKRYGATSNAPAGPLPCPGTVSFAVQIIDQIPASLAGRVAAAVVQASTSKRTTAAPATARGLCNEEPIKQALTG